MSYDKLHMLPKRAGSRYVEYAAAPPSQEVLPSPLAARPEKVAWYEDSPKTLYPLRSGDIFVGANAVCGGSDKFISARLRHDGSIFDDDGFYHQQDFLLTMAHDTPAVSTGVRMGVDLQYAREHNYLDVSASSPFDGSTFNYYHWLIEGLTSAHILQEHKRLGVPLLVVGRDHLSKWQRQYLSLMGIEKIILIDGEENDIINVRQLCWTKHRDIVYNSAATILDLSHRLIVAAGRTGVAVPACKRLYVRRFGSRSITNDSQVFSYLQKHGFVAVVLEELSVCEQIALFEAAKIIVAPHGAGLANLLFCRQNAAVIELLPMGEVRNYFWILSAKVGVRYHFVVCSAEHSFAGSMDVDIAELDETLRLAKS